MTANSISEPLFAGVHQACLFAFTFSANSAPVAAVAEREMLQFARERYQTGFRGSGKGLVGVDGAAQAGMILARLGACLDLASFEVLTCMFALKSPTLRNAAIQSLGKRCAYNHPTEVLLHSVLVRYYFNRRYAKHKQITLVEILQQANFSRNTLNRRWHDAKQMLRGLEDRAVGQAYDALKEQGVIS